MNKTDDTAIIRKFTKTFDTEPTHLVSVPGRVNLIGEHTDYNGFPVMPISIPHTLSAAVSPRTDKAVHIRNTDSAYC